MTEVEIANGYLRVVVEGFDKVLALKSSVEVPLIHVRGASQDPDALRERHGLRLGGTSLPGVVAAGTFYDGRWWFLDVHHPEVAVKIELDHEHYAALIVEVANPAGPWRPSAAITHRANLLTERPRGRPRAAGRRSATRADATDSGSRRSPTAFGLGPRARTSISVAG